MPNIKQCRKVFVVETLILFVSIRGRINFLQLARSGKYKEQRYRQQFEKVFDFLAFNKEHTLSQGSGRYAVAFDPSYVSKSGKKTPGAGWYWSGCASSAKWGLEIGGLATINIDNHTAFHLEAVQTLNADGQSLADWYGSIISDRKDTLIPSPNTWLQMLGSLKGHLPIKLSYWACIWSAGLEMMQI